MAEIYNIKDFRKENDRERDDNELEADICIDYLVEEWMGSFAFKLKEIEYEYGIEAAYHFFSRVCSHDMDISRDFIEKVVEIYLEVEDEI